MKKLNIDVAIGFVPYDPYVSLDEIEENFEYVRKLDLLGMAGDMDAPYSLSSALIAVAGTDFRQELELNKMFIPNERGYVFKSAEVETYYYLKNKWLDKTKDIIYNLFFLSLRNIPLYECNTSC